MAGGRAAEMAGQTDYGDGSYICYVWRMCGSISATLADALDEDGGDESSCGSWRQLRWGLDRLWRSDNKAAKRARRSKRRESEREVANGARRDRITRPGLDDLTPTRH